MSRKNCDIAKRKYVDGAWPKSYIDQLYKAKRLTKAEYEEVLAAKDGE